MFEDYYGLRARPFQLTPDPAFYFLSAAHRKAQSYLSYGLAQAEGMIVITGDPGSGKSTILAQLLAQNDPDQRTIVSIISSALDASGVIQALSLALGLGSYEQDKAAALAAIRLFLEEEAVAGRRCLLLVDDAQNLSPDAFEELRLLSSHQLLNHALLQVLLLGDSALRQAVMASEQMAPFRQRVVASYHVGPLEEGEAQAYVFHRLEAAGYQGLPELDSALFAQAHKASHGNLAWLNQIINRLLLFAAVEERGHCSLDDLANVVGELQDSGALGASAPAGHQALTPPSADTSEMLGGLLFQQNAQADMLAARDTDMAAMSGCLDDLQRRVREQEAALRLLLINVIQRAEENRSSARAALA